MALGIESGDYIGVPVPAGIERPDPEALFRFRYLNNDRIEVHHPFHGTTIIGNGEAFGSASMDAAAVVLFQEMPFLVDCMKLNRIRAYETRLFAGEYPELSHCFSLGVLSTEFGGGPMDVLDAFYNDASKIYDGHQGDDNYQGHGSEDLHDRERASFFERAGIIKALIEAGTLRRELSGIYVGPTRLTIDRLLSEEEVTVRASFLSNKHPARRLDADRFQYNAEESWLNRWAANRKMPEPGRIPIALAELSLSSVSRRVVLEDGEGDQLVYTDDQAAFNDALEYIRHNTEHWTEPVQDLVNDILNLAERYFFVCRDDHARNFHYFYPRDYLHTSASYIFEQFTEVAKTDRVMKWFLDTAAMIAADQRQKNLKYNNGNQYQGPNPPEGVQLTRIDSRPNPEGFDVVNDEFVIDLPAGKMRTINPRIINGGSMAIPLSQLRPEFEDIRSDYQRWAGDYQARVKIEDPDLAIEIKQALDVIRRKWPGALDRPLMPPAELQRTIAQANEYVLRVGKIALAHKPSA
jgi:hypothetical protein